MKSNREQLAQDLAAAYGDYGKPTGADYAAADALISAGWTRS